MDSPICLSPTSSSSSVADDKPDAKRRILSLPPGKVAVICNCVTMEGYFYYIVIIDLNSKTHDFVDDEFISAAPTVGIKRGRYDTNGFCILGSTFYMIESAGKMMVPPPKSVYTIDLSSYLHDDDDVVTKPDLKILEKSELGKTPDMLHPKSKPFGIPTPDGKKMLVFSSIIRHEYGAEIVGVGAFELYDPENKTWKQLPGIHSENSYGTYFWIAAFAFIGRSTFFIETDTELMYSIDLESLDQGWKQCETFYGRSTTRCWNFPFYLIDEELCLTSACAYDVTKEEREWYFPRPSYGVQFRHCGHSSVILLGNVKNEQCNFGILESGLGQQTKYPHLTIDKYHCDVSKYREDKKKNCDDPELSTSITHVRCFKFLLDVEKCTVFYTPKFFSI
ncbi:hypothetical protein DH2020_027826 [Rehmannia glutinosa]|uniref:Uncharacterized protein n=1 Tax=Rehmannia glutinosa TaxID=99300 RepID=A0ABR0VW10_REHGL